MKQIIVGECAQDRLLTLTDPDVPSEAEFEHTVARALSCAYPHHICAVFSGGFQLDTDIFKPDLALVARDFSHWFVVEVELTSHSFERHVLPQVRGFQYGSPVPSCATSLISGLGIASQQAQTLIRHVPRSVVVVANKREETWIPILRSHNIQFVAVSSFKAPNGTEALEIDGQILAVKENLGFGIYSATDRSLRFPRNVRIPEGDVQISDPAGSNGIWTVIRDQKYAWISKERGSPDIPDQSFVQIIKTIDGQLSLRRPEIR